MAKSINKFIVRLADQTSYSPQLAVSVVPIKEQKKTYEVRIVNPNTKEIVHQEEFKSSAKEEVTCFLEALAHGKQLLEKPAFKMLQMSIPYVPQIFPSQGRRGKMKLKTRDSEEAIQERKEAQEKADEEAEHLLIEDDSDDGLPEFQAEDVPVGLDDEGDDDMSETEAIDVEDDEPRAKKKKPKAVKNKASTKTEKVKTKNKKKEVKKVEVKKKTKNKKKK